MTLNSQRVGQNPSLHYTIDMEKDVIDRITFSTESERESGRLEFTYLQDVEQAHDEFAVPKTNKYGRLKQGIGMKWLFELAKN